MLSLLGCDLGREPVSEVERGSELGDSCDTETTGLWDEAEIVEILILRGDGETLLDTLVKPKGTIPDEVIGIHGITNEMVQDAPTWPEVWNQVKEVITSYNVLIYNAEFDSRLIEQTCQKWGIEPVPFKSECVMHTYMMWQGADRWFKLSDAIGYDVEHRALSDCLAVYRLIENEGREWVVKREMTPELIQLKKENEARLEEIWKKREEKWKREQWEREQQELAEYCAFLELATSLEPINIGDE